MTNQRQTQPYFIRVTNVNLFNAIVRTAEDTAPQHGATFQARRNHGYYELLTSDRALWHELYLYAQMLAQAQDENIEGGQDQTT